MKIRILLLFWLSGSTWMSMAQSNYFQQEVNYTIEGELNDKEHTLTGSAEIEYVNHSPDKLDFLYFHLWGNAYKDRTTAFSKQKLRQRSTDFYFAEAKNLGGFTSLDFFVNEKKITWNYDPEHIDIVRIELPQTLHPGEKIIVTTPFTLKIPASFSRLGHVGESYQITQWYPKPAVYDSRGWHQMPYLDQGEFYSEFGNFDVKITLPKNYVVGATGELQTESEKAFLQRKIEETKSIISGQTSRTTDFPPSNEEKKTLHYLAENVHDFAWFADKRFMVQKNQVVLASGKKVDTWAMFTAEEMNLWENAIDYIDRSVKFYSELVGEYPYPHATAIQSALSAGAGMEYPMITVIGTAGGPRGLDNVIMHEVGHNWFYGILASNERDHPWIDEGINSYYEHRYMRKYYEGQSEIPNFFLKGSKLELRELPYLLQARKRIDQAPNTSSDEFTLINYYVGAYEKPALIFRHLEKYLGTMTFDKLMQKFYQEWKFRHPHPEDLRTFLEEETQKDLSWLFDDYIQTNRQLDYTLASVEKKGKGYQLNVKNKGEIVAPFSISAMNGEEIVQTKWFEGVEESKLLRFPSGDYDRFVLDAERATLDIKRQNNSIKSKGIFKKIEPFQLKLLAGLENDERSTLYAMPIFAWNNYDKLMPGLFLYNAAAPSKPFEFQLLPMYSFTSKELKGLASAGYSFYPKKGLFQKVKLELNAKSFSYNYNNHYGFHDSYQKLAPELTLEFRKARPNSSRKHNLFYRYVDIKQQYGQGKNYETRNFETKERRYAINELNYSFSDKKVIAPLELNGTLQLGKGFSRLFADAKQKITYAKRGKALYLHAFAGTFLKYDTPEAFVNFTLNGKTGFNIFQKDYLFDEVLFGRNDRTGIFSQQLFQKDAHLKTLATLGSSTEWMMGFGVSTSLPIPIPVHAYMDFAIYPDNFSNEINLSYSGGFSIIVAKDIFELYFPVLESDDIKEANEFQGQSKYFNRISFLLNLNQVNPFKLRDEIEF
ncbi:MAG: M1 family metallopeptidase [Bacteroidetes bacterium]|nr:M1 family metallopeptidase [Bacteroidota bacterium]